MAAPSTPGATGLAIGRNVAGTPDAAGGKAPLCFPRTTFVAHTRAAYRAPLPRYVTDAFERYVLCGDFSQGFIRCHCDACGHDVLVPFSCKQRGLCPSCGARRMCDEAATVTDRILPNVPVRQWVLSRPSSFAASPR
jgi:hypothetical protein